MFFDIHSHILPDVDDGAKNLKDSVALLKLMKKSGISTVLATSHFYPMNVNFDDYVEVTKNAFNELKSEIKGKKLPKVYLGCEMLYYSGIGNSDVLGELCLNQSKYLLLEFCDTDINERTFEDLLNLKNNKGIVPIIAHVERNSAAKDYKKFLLFLKENNIPVQINAASVLIKPYRKVIRTILESGIFCILATDTHSVEERPPLMKEAYCFIRDNFGPKYREKLAKNGKLLYKEIIGENIEK